MMWRPLLALCLLLASSQATHAQTCNVSIGNVNFGTVDILAGAAVDVTATMNISCTGILLLTVRICPSIGAGSGGADATARYMQGPSGTLAYQLYTNAARTTVWGSNYWGLGGAVPNIDVPLGLGGSGNTSRTIFARLFSGQTTAPTGTYTSNFTVTDDVFNYNYSTIILSCLSLPLVGQVANPTFTAQATINKNCSVSAQDLNFGTHGVLAATIDANGQVSATCTSDTPYTIALDDGGSGGGPTAREMTMGPSSITYGIYQDAARTEPWGDTMGTTLGGTGNGLTQNLPTYGRVPPQTTPAPGTYTDTIVVTLTY